MFQGLFLFVLFKLQHKVVEAEMCYLRNVQKHSWTLKQKNLSGCSNLLMKHYLASLKIHL